MVDINNNIIYGGVGVVALALVLRRRQAASAQPQQPQQAPQQADVVPQTEQQDDRIDIGFLENVQEREEALDEREEEIQQGIEEAREELSHVSAEDGKSPAQVIRDNRDELPDDVQWEMRVEYDPETGEAYNPAQYAWLVSEGKV